MKTEIGAKRPDFMKEIWPGQYRIFSHFEFACGIPQLLFAVTTLKENGMPNVSFCSWSCFQGDGNGYFAIIAGVYPYSHTYANIARTKEFCVNFLGKSYYDNCAATIKNNEEDTDEFKAGGFTIEPPKTVSCPRIGESFLCLECGLEKFVPLCGDEGAQLIVGRVQNVIVDEEYAKGIDGKYGENGFMFNVHSPMNLAKGACDDIAVATLEVGRRFR